MSREDDFRIGKRLKRSLSTESGLIDNQEYVNQYFENDPEAAEIARKEIERQQVGIARSPSGRNPSVVVFGAGIAGLSTAHELIERGFSVQVVEPTPSIKHEYECEVGGMARTQLARARETQKIHPYLFFEDNIDPYKNNDFPEIYSWDRPPEGHPPIEQSSYPWLPVYHEDRNPKSSFRYLIRRRIAAIRQLTFRQAQPAIGTPEQLVFDQYSIDLDLTKRDAHGKTNAVKLESLVSRLIAAYGTYFKDFVVDLRRTKYRLEDIIRDSPEYLLREVLVVEVSGYSAPVASPLSTKTIAWERAVAVKNAIAEAVATALAEATGTDGEIHDAKKHLEENSSQYSLVRPKDVVNLFWDELELLRDGLDKGPTPKDHPNDPACFFINHLVAREGAKKRDCSEQQGSHDKDNYVSISIVEHELAGEHGYRFFPSFYRHLFDVMARTPLYDSAGVESAETMRDMLKTPPPVAIGLHDGKHFHESARQKYESVEDLRLGLKLVFEELNVAPRDSIRMMIQVFKFLTSSNERRQKYEDISWLQFIDGESELDPSNWHEAMDDRTGYTEKAEHLIRELPQALIAMGAEETDAATYGVVSSQLFVDYQGDGDNTDQTLRGPTSDVWLTHWKEYLKKQGVQFFVGRITQLVEEENGEELVPTVEGISALQEVQPEEPNDELKHWCDSIRYASCTLNIDGPPRNIISFIPKQGQTLQGSTAIAVLENVNEFEYKAHTGATKALVQKGAIVGNGSPVAKAEVIDPLTGVGATQVFNFNGIGTERLVKSIDFLPLPHDLLKVELWRIGEVVFIDECQQGVIEKIYVNAGDVVSDGTIVAAIRTAPGRTIPVLCKNIGNKRTILNIPANTGDAVKSGQRLLELEQPTNIFQSEIEKSVDFTRLVTSGSVVSDGDYCIEVPSVISGKPPEKKIRLEGIGENRVISDIKIKPVDRDFSKNTFEVELHDFATHAITTCNGILAEPVLGPMGGAVNRTVQDGDDIGQIIQVVSCRPPDFYVLATPYEQSVELLNKSYRMSRISIQDKLSHILRQGSYTPQDKEDLSSALIFLFNHNNTAVSEFLNGFDSLATSAGSFPLWGPLKNQLQNQLQNLNVTNKFQDSYETCKDLFKPGISFDGDFLSLIGFNRDVVGMHDDNGVSTELSPISNDPLPALFPPPYELNRDHSGRPLDSYRIPLRDFFGIQYYFSGQVRLGDGHLTFPDSPWGVSSISQIFQWRQRPSRKLGYLGQLSVDVGDVYKKDHHTKHSAWNSSADEIAENVWRQILEATEDSYRRHVAEPDLYHIDQSIKFSEPLPGLGVPTDTFAANISGPCAVETNTAPYFICLPKQWKHRPGLVRDPFRGSEAEYGEWFWSNVGIRDILYKPSHSRWFLAGSYMPTKTRLTTMESACESARHTVNGILHALISDREDKYLGSGKLVGEPAKIYDPERFEFSALDPLKRLDAELMKEGLPHFLDILGVLDYFDSISASDNPEDNPLGNLIRLLQQASFSTFKDWEPQLKSMLGTYTGNIDKVLKVMRDMYSQGQELVDSSTKRTDQ